MVTAGRVAAVAAAGFAAVRLVSTAAVAESAAAERNSIAAVVEVAAPRPAGIAGSEADRLVEIRFRTARVPCNLPLIPTRFHIGRQVRCVVYLRVIGCEGMERRNT